MYIMKTRKNTLRRKNKSRMRKRRGGAYHQYYDAAYRIMNILGLPTKLEQNSSRVDTTKINTFAGLLTDQFITEYRDISEFTKESLKSLLKKNNINY